MCARSLVSNKRSIAFEADLVAAGATTAAVPKRVFASPVRGLWPSGNLPTWSLIRNVFLALTAGALSIGKDEATEI